MENFNLVSIELDVLGGANVSYTIDGIEGPEEFKTKQTRVVHPDLSNLFQDGLRKRVTWLLGFSEDAEPIVTPIGLSIPSAGTVIYQARVIGPVASYKVKTPKIQAGADDVPLIAEIEKEAKAYIEGKSAQLSIFGDE